MHQETSNSATKKEKRKKEKKIKKKKKEKKLKKAKKKKLSRDPAEVYIVFSHKFLICSISRAQDCQRASPRVP